MDLPTEHSQRVALVRARILHWRAARRVTAVLLALWLVTTFGTIYFARPLSAIHLFGWPLSFYLAAQGAALVYLAILGAYALAMRRLDRRFQRQLRELG
ncbi:MAG: DUF4212 domain-containing protein [Pseudomonadota bacterium]